MKNVKELLKYWEDKAIYNKNEITMFFEAVDPPKVDKNKLNKAFPPPVYLINYSKNQKEYQIKSTKVNELNTKLKELIT